MSRRFTRRAAWQACRWSPDPQSARFEWAATVRSPAYLVLAAETVHGGCRRRSMPAHGPGPRPKESAEAEALAAGQRRIAKGERILKTASAFFAARLDQPAR